MTTTTSGLSFLNQSQTQIARLKQLNTTLADLQRQLTTQKKHENLSGFGAAAQSVQKLRIDANLVQTYLTNTNTVSTRIELMSSSMQQGADSGRQLIESIATQIREGEVDMATVSAIARNQLDLMGDIANLEIDGRYLFAGSATDTEPYTNGDNFDITLQGMIADWESGAITTAQFITNIENFTSTDIGFNPALSSAGNVTAQIDKNVNLDYTSIATQNGFQQVMLALAVAANITETPDPALSPPGPSSSDFQQVLDTINGIARQGVEAVDSANGLLGIKFSTLQTVQDNHQTDAATLDKLLIEKENVDTTEVAVQIQSLQTQLSASYEVTSLVSQLSLVNFL
jgi:flagellar hook-associated protein 3 FlgL